MEKQLRTELRAEDRRRLVAGVCRLEKGWELALPVAKVECGESGGVNAVIERLGDRRGDWRISMRMCVVVFVVVVVVVVVFLGGFLCTVHRWVGGRSIGTAYIQECGSADVGLPGQWLAGWLEKLRPVSAGRSVLEARKREQKERRSCACRALRINENRWLEYKKGNTKVYWHIR